METPLSRYFYDALQRSGMTLGAVAHRANLALSTVGHYVNGLRGSGGQPRTTRTIRAIAAAMDADPDEAVRLAGLQGRDGAVQGILDDPVLSEKQKTAMVAILEQLRGR